MKTLPPAPFGMIQFADEHTWLRQNSVRSSCRFVSCYTCLINRQPYFVKPDLDYYTSSGLFGKDCRLGVLPLLILTINDSKNRLSSDKLRLQVRLPLFFLKISSWWVKIRLHNNNQFPRLTWSLSGGGVVVGSTQVLGHTNFVFG